MKLHFLGADRQVTGSCYAVDAERRMLLVDCGYYQEREFQGRNWAPTPVDVGSLHSVLLTHAHLDHCGLLPKLVREGFDGPIYATPPTIDLARLVLEDSAHIQMEDMAYKKRRHQKEGRKSPHPYEPLTRIEDVHKVTRQFQPVPYEKDVSLGAGISFRLHDAGHILGSAIVELNAGEGADARRLVFSGDLGRPDVPIVRDPTIVERADGVVIESTYGDREHEHSEEIEDQLAEIISATAARGGKVIIPTFAIERAQELIIHLAALVESRRIPRLPAFLDSPMAVDATEIFRNHVDYMDGPTQELVHSSRLARLGEWFRFTRSSAESKEINTVRGPCIVLAGSGMCTGGRIKHHLVQNIERPEATILFSGYQAAGTLGRHIVSGEHEVRIHGRMYQVRAEVRQVQGLSAHAGRHDLLSWLGGFRERPGRVFVTHGEEHAALALADSARADLGLEVDVPHYLDEVEVAAAGESAPL